MAKIHDSMTKSQFALEYIKPSQSGSKSLWQYPLIQTFGIPHSLIDAQALTTPTAAT